MASDLSHRTILVTGATDGLGRGVALDLASRRANILIHGRDAAKASAVADEIAASTGARPHVYLADFASLADVRAMADAIKAAEPRLDGLVNNAGLGIEPHRRGSKDGHEMIFQVDYLSGFLLTHLLLPLLKASAPAQVVNVASAGQAPSISTTSCWSGAGTACRPIARQNSRRSP